MRGRRRGLRNMRTLASALSVLFIHLHSPTTSVKKALNYVSDYQLKSACNDAICIAPSKITQIIFAVLEDWYHHIVLTHSFKLVFLTYNHHNIVIPSYRHGITNVLAVYLAESWIATADMNFQRKHTSFRGAEIDQSTARCYYEITSSERCIIVSLVCCFSWGFLSLCLRPQQ